MTEIRESEKIKKQLTHEQIEKRAYEIYLQHGGEEGHALEDWLIAEKELSQKSSKREPAPLKSRTAVAVKPSR